MHLYTIHDNVCGHERSVGAPLWRRAGLVMHGIRNAAVTIYRSIYFHQVHKISSSIRPLLVVKRETFFYYKQIGYIVSIAYIQLNYVAFTCNTLKSFFEEIYYEEVI